MSPLSIKDIARLAGVVPSTVSFVINGKEKQMRISSEMVTKIRKIIEETGYVPNRSAVSLRTGRTHLIGLIVEDISNAFFSLLAKTIEDIANNVGYKVVYCSTENNDKKGNELISMLHKQVDGFIITPTGGMRDQIIKLQKAKKPVVLLDRYFVNTKIPYVMVDNKTSIETGVNLLVKKGYKNIAFVITALEQVQMRERLIAFESSMKQHKKYNAKYILTLPFSPKEDAYEKAIKNFLKKNKAVDAVFFATNYLTINGLKVLQDLKIEIPQQIAVLSFDDHDIFKLYRPGITAINQPIAEIARQGIEMLTEQMNKGTEEKEQGAILLNAELILRGSV